MKKTSQADLENERTTFFLLGFVLVLATLFVLLEWTTEESLSPDWAGFSSLLIEEEYNESLAVALESQKSSLETPEKEMEKQPTLVAYEDFNVAEKTPDTEEALHKLFDETNAEPEKPVSQVTEEQIQAIDPIYTEAEVMPQFPGGYTELNRFLFARLEYPPSAYSQRIQGKVWCSFIVNKDGSVSDVRVEKGVYISLDQESLRVLQQQPGWIPGTIRGENVRVKVYLPIVFKL